MTALRSNFTPGTSRWAVRRAQWSALGISPEDQEKPKIAIVNTSDPYAPRVVVPIIAYVRYLP